jgi:hypothetical protein
VGYRPGQGGALPLLWLLLSCADHPLVVPNASECAGVYFVAPVGDGCVPPEKDQPGSLAGAEGSCQRTAAMDGLASSWAVLVASGDFRGEVRCTAPGCASPRFEIADRTAPPGAGVVGTYVDDERGTCDAAWFPNAHDQRLFLLPDQDGTALDVPNDRNEAGDVVWGYVVPNAGCPSESREKGTLVGGEGRCLAVCGPDGLLSWILTVRELRAPVVSCDTRDRRSPDFRIVDGPPSPGISMLSGGKVYPGSEPAGLE